MSEELEAALRELEELDAEIGLSVEERDFSINKRGAEPVDEDHTIDAHEHKERLSAERNAPEELHLRRQELVDRIDRLRLGE